MDRQYNAVNFQYFAQAAEAGVTRAGAEASFKRRLCTSRLSFYIEVPGEPIALGSRPWSIAVVLCDIVHQGLFMVSLINSHDEPYLRSSYIIS